MSKHLSSATMPEFFGSRFHSQGMKIVASLIIFVFLIPYTASVYNGLSRLFGMAFDIPYSVCVMGHGYPDSGLCHPGRLYGHGHQ